MMYRVAVRLQKGGDETKLVSADDPNAAFLAAVAQFGRAYGDNCYGIVVLGPVTGS